MLMLPRQRERTASRSRSSHVLEILPGADRSFSGQNWTATGLKLREAAASSRHGTRL